MTFEAALAFLAGFSLAMFALTGCVQVLPCAPAPARVQWDDTMPIYTMQNLVPLELDPAGETAVPMPGKP